MSRTQAVNREFLLKQWGRLRVWLGAQIARKYFWLATQQVTRKDLDRNFLVGFSAVVALILYSRPELFGARAWATSILVGVILLLAAAVYYRLARTIFPKEFPQRIRIRPFTSLREKSTYSGQALARLLELTMQPPDRSEEAPPSRVGLEPKVPAFNVSVAGATISLDFIWGSVERWILGPPYIVEAIISQSGRTIIIEAWSTERAAQWRAESSPDTESDPLRTAIANLAEQMKASFGHHRELRDTCETQRRYADAIRFAERLDKVEQGTGTRLAYLYFNAGRLDDAESTFEEALEESNDVQVQSEALRGLALVRAARGRHSEAIALLKKVRQGVEAQAAKLEAARVLSYRKKFRGAKKLLQSLSTDIECRLEHLLKAKLRALSVEALRSKRDNLDEGDQVQLYIDLGDLADLHGNLGRCAEELDEPEQAQLGYRFAAAVLVQRSSLWIPYHLTAANIGIWLEDLARYNPDMYDIAIDANNRQFQDAYDYYRENPKDCSALMNMAWAVAGNVSCLAEKVEIAKRALDSAEGHQQVAEGAEQAADLLQFIPTEQWQVVMSEAMKYYKTGAEGEVKSRHAIKPLSREQTKQVVQLVASLLQVMDPVSALALMSWIAQRKRGDEEAQLYFAKLAEKRDDANMAEALFGLACVHATCGRYDQALVHLAEAIEHIEDFKNRARVDEDLRVLRGDERYREAFAKLVQWDRTSVTNAQ